LSDAEQGSTERLHRPTDPESEGDGGIEETAGKGREDEDADGEWKAEGEGNIEPVYNEAPSEESAEGQNEEETDKFEVEGTAAMESMALLLSAPSVEEVTTAVLATWAPPSARKRNLRGWKDESVFGQKREEGKRTGSLQQ
jgi:hypothetical protein